MMLSHRGQLLFFWGCLVKNALSKNLCCFYECLGFRKWSNCRMTSEEIVKLRQNPMQSYTWQCMPQVRLWELCPQNTVWTKQCRVESLAADILGFSDQEKSKAVLPSKWDALCISGTSNTDENKQLLTERLCVQTTVTNEKPFLHPHREHALKLI